MKLKTVLANAASGQQTSGTASDTDADVVDSPDSTVTFGRGFYGSAKVVTRGVGAGSDDASAATAADQSADAPAAGAAGDDAAAAAEAEISSDVPGSKPVPPADSRPDTASILTALASPTAAAPSIAGKTPAASSPQASFVEENHPKIVDSIQGQLLPRGGTMQLQLHPAELGSMQVTVQMKDGVITASFQTSNESATKLLTRSLGQLKTGLEAAGVSVEKLHVEQVLQGDFNSNSNDGSKQPSQDQQQQAQQDQQRRELIRQMWKKLSGGDPLDLVA